jgi:hypothetical protein
VSNALNLPISRRLERWLIGLAMAILAWLLEKALLRSIKHGSSKPSLSRRRSMSAKQIND